MTNLRAEPRSPSRTDVRWRRGCLPGRARQGLTSKCNYLFVYTIMCSYNIPSMLETSDYPTVARVMRIAPGPDEKPAAGFSWGDYEDVDDARVTADDADGEDDGGWGVVKSRGRPSTHFPQILHALILTFWPQKRKRLQLVPQQHQNR